MVTADPADFSPPMRRIPSWMQLATYATALFAGLHTTCLAGNFENPRFSPDEKSVAVDYCEEKCSFVVYQFETKSAITFAAPSSEAWITPAFSPSSDELVFVVSRGPRDSQIALITLEGEGFQLLTTSRNVKRSPSYSPDGKLIIYSVQEEHAGERGAFVRSDAYLLDIASREERRITDLRVGEVKAPRFLPDGKRFTFSTVGAAFPRSKLPAAMVDLERLNSNRNVYVFAIQGPQNLKPLTNQLPYVVAPQPIETGEIALLGQVNELDKIKGAFVFDVFLAGKDDTVRRLTRFQSYVRSYGISQSGRFIVFITHGKDARRDSSKVMLWKKDAPTPVELTIPRARVIQVTY